MLPLQRWLDGMPAVTPHEHLVPRIRAMTLDADVLRGSNLLSQVHVRSPRWVSSAFGALVPLACCGCR